MSNPDIMIRREEPRDYREAETLTREAFWNVYKPGCDEHYLLHVMRAHPDFIPELTFVAEQEGRIVGHVAFLKAWLVYETGEKREILSFGPLSVHPDHKRQGIGKRLMAHAFAEAKAMGHEVVVIYGNPENYVTSGFRSSSHFNIGLEGGIFLTSLLALELKPGALDGRRCSFQDSTVFTQLTEEAAEEFDRQFPPKKKGWQPSQELFYIYSHSQVHLPSEGEGQ